MFFSKSISCCCFFFLYYFLIHLDFFKKLSYQILTVTTWFEFSFLFYLWLLFSTSFFFVFFLFRIKPITYCQAFVFHTPPTSIYVLYKYICIRNFWREFITYTWAFIALLYTHSVMLLLLPHQYLFTSV